MIIEYTHDKLRNPSFPMKELLAMGIDVAVSTKKTKWFEEHYLITIPPKDMEGESEVNTAFNLGMLIHSFLVLNK
jgi:hypothetical protein